MQPATVEHPGSSLVAAQKKIPLLWPPLTSQQNRGFTSPRRLLQHLDTLQPKSAKKPHFCWRNRCTRIRSDRGLAKTCSQRRLNPIGRCALPMVIDQPLGRGQRRSELGVGLNFIDCATHAVRESQREFPPRRRPGEVTPRNERVRCYSSSKDKWNRIGFPTAGRSALIAST